VPRIAYGNARTEINVALAFDVPEFGILRTLDIDRRDIALATRDRRDLAFLPLGVAYSGPGPRRFCSTHQIVSMRKMPVAPGQIAIIAPNGRVSNTGMELARSGRRLVAFHGFFGLLESFFDFLAGLFDLLARFLGLLHCFRVSVVNLLAGLFGRAFLFATAGEDCCDQY
jgi:hypothetical protein